MAEETMAEETMTGDTMTGDTMTQETVAETKTGTKKKREYNLELLRCLCMLMVVTLHYNNGSLGGAFNYVVPGSGDGNILYLLESISIIAVNVFVIISGFFMCRSNKRNIRKPLGLYLMAASYRVLSTVGVCHFAGTALTLPVLLQQLIPKDWFVNVYIVLYFVSPYINLSLKKLSKKNFGILLVFMLILFSIWGTLVDMNGQIEFGCNPLVAAGGDAGYSICNFVFMYCIGAYIHMWYKKYSIWIDVGVYAVSTGLVFYFSGGSFIVWNYNNIFVVTASVALFMLFKRMKINIRWIQCVISFIGAATFGIYLLHTKELFYSNFWKLFDIPVNVQAGGTQMILNFAAAIFAMFGVCLVIDTVFRLIVKPISILLNKIKPITKYIIDLT